MNDKVQRDEQIAAIHDLADWLAANPDMPMPSLNLFRHLNHTDGTDAECLDLVRDLAASIGVAADEHLDDRTVLRYRVNGKVWYELFAWHKAGRGAIDEVDRLRARVAELEARGPRVAEPDPTGMAYTRADDDAVDPTQPGPREPLHTGGMTESGLVDETGDGSYLVDHGPVKPPYGTTDREAYDRAEAKPVDETGGFWRGN